LKIAAFQSDIMKRDDFLLKENYYLDNTKDADVIVFPERFLKESVELDDLDLFRLFENISKEKLLIAGSLLIRENQNLYNRSYIYFNGKKIGYQDKIVPFSRERSVITSGEVINIFSNSILTFSVAICYDIDFPFFAKLCSINGVDVIFNPSLIRRDFHNEWHQYIKTRALENRISVLSVNSLSERFNGNTIMANPYEESDAVRIKVDNFNEQDCVKTELFRDKSIVARMKQRISEDPGSYSFPVKKIVY
jgi:omega-amidase